MYFAASFTNFLQAQRGPTGLHVTHHDGHSDNITPQVGLTGSVQVP